MGFGTLPSTATEISPKGTEQPRNWIERGKEFLKPILELVQFNRDEVKEVEHPLERQMKQKERAESRFWTRKQLLNEKGARKSLPELLQISTTDLATIARITRGLGQDGKKDLLLAQEFFGIFPTMKSLNELLNSGVVIIHEYDRLPLETQASPAIGLKYEYLKKIISHFEKILFHEFMTRPKIKEPTVTETVEEKPKKSEKLTGMVITDSLRKQYAQYFAKNIRIAEKRSLKVGEIILFQERKGSRERQGTFYGKDDQGNLLIQALGTETLILLPFEHSSLIRTFPGRPLAKGDPRQEKIVIGKTEDIAREAEKRRWRVEAKKKLKLGPQADNDETPKRRVA